MNARTRTTGVARALLAIATVAALGVGMASAAFGEESASDPPVAAQDVTTTTTDPATDPPVDPCAVDPAPEDCTPPVDLTTPAGLETSALEFGALDVGALAANSITVSPVVGAQDLPGTFTIRLQGCTVVFGICIYADVASADVASGASHTFTGLTATVSCGFTTCSRRYQVLSDYESGYGLVSVTGCGGTAVAPGLLTAGGRNFGTWVNGQDLSCTFNYVEYKVTVTKAVTAAPDSSWSFPVRLFSLGVYDQTVNLTAAEPTQTFRTVPTALAGYALTEGTPEGWRLTSATCTGSGNGTAIGLLPPRVTGVTFGALFAEPTRECTFTNTNNRVSVAKVVDPTSFGGSFDVELEQCDFNVFNLCGPSDWHSVDSASVSGSTTATFSTLAGTYFDRYYRLSEDVPAGWSSDLTCSGGRSHTTSGGYAYFLFPLDQNAAADVSCTVTNTASPASITIVKSTVPGDGGPFGFTSSLGDFSLSDGESQPFTGLDPGDYTFTETSGPADEDWVLVQFDCVVDENGENTTPVTPVRNGDTWTVPLGAGQDVTCTAENRQASIALDITASPTSGVVGDTITFEYTVTNTGKVSLTNVAVVSTRFGPITLGTTDLAPGDSTSGSQTHTAIVSDVPQITDTATATADIDATSSTSADVGADALDPVSVSATASVDVSIAQVGGEVVTRDGGANASGQLPFTGNDSTGLLAGGVLALLAGLGLGALAWRSRRGALDA